MKQIILLLILFATVVSCKNANTNTSQNTSEPGGQQQPTEIAKNLNLLPFIPLDEYKKLAQSTNAIDVIPFGSSVTMNITDQASCYQFIASYILDTQVSQTPCKQPQGRIFFNKDGSSILEADIHFNDECKYLVFFKPDNTTPIYATEISDKGKDYFAKLFSEDAMNELQKLQKGGKH
jgi:hypothetical protein